MARDFVRIIVERAEPVQAEDAAGDYREDDVNRDIALRNRDCRCIHDFCYPFLGVNNCLYYLQRRTAPNYYSI